MQRSLVSIWTRLGHISKGSSKTNMKAKTRNKNNRETNIHYKAPRWLLTGPTFSFCLHQLAFTLSILSNNVAFWGLTSFPFIYRYLLAPPRDNGDKPWDSPSKRASWCRLCDPWRLKQTAHMTSLPVLAWPLEIPRMSFLFSYRQHIEGILPRDEKAISLSAPTPKSGNKPWKWLVNEHSP